MLDQSKGHGESPSALPCPGWGPRAAHPSCLLPQPAFSLGFQTDLTLPGRRLGPQLPLPHLGASNRGPQGSQQGTLHFSEGKSRHSWPPHLQPGPDGANILLGASLIEPKGCTTLLSPPEVGPSGGWDSARWYLLPLSQPQAPSSPPQPSFVTLSASPPSSLVLHPGLPLSPGPAVPLPSSHVRAHSRPCGPGGKGRQAVG